MLLGNVTHRSFASLRMTGLRFVVILGAAKDLCVSLAIRPFNTTGSLEAYRRAVISSMKAFGFAVISAHPGLNPARRALRTERMLDQAAQ